MSDEMKKIITLSIVLSLFGCCKKASVSQADLVNNEVAAIATARPLPTASQARAESEEAKKKKIDLERDTKIAEIWARIQRAIQEGDRFVRVTFQESDLKEYASLINNLKEKGFDVSFHFSTPKEKYSFLNYDPGNYMTVSW